MKITDPEVIKSGEKDLIASVQEDLDPEMVREILKQRLALATLAPKGGKIVVHNNEIAFKLDFEVNLSGSLLFDRNGNILDQVSSVNAEETKPEDTPAAEQQNSESDSQRLEQDDLDLDLDIDPDDSDLSDWDSDDFDPDSLDLDDLDLDGDQASHDDTEDKTGDLDEDINDLLRESREFWAQNRKS